MEWATSISKRAHAGPWVGTHFSRGGGVPIIFKNSIDGGCDSYILGLLAGDTIKSILYGGS